MRLSVVLAARVVVSALGLVLVAATPLMPQDPQEGADKLALAESVIAREEAASERAFDPTFRAKAKELLATRPLADLVSQTGDGGLGLSSLGDSQADLVYTPVTPCRIIDTRLAGGTLAPGLPRSFKVTGDTTFQGGANCGIPFGPTTSAMINFVAVSPTGKGNMMITPFGQAMPTASFINFSNTAGTNLANGLAVAMCNPSAATCISDITIQANNSAVDLVADVQGYFQRVSTGGVGTALLADSAVTAAKIGSGAVGTTQLANGSVTSAKIDETTVQARVSGTCGPSGAIQGVNQNGTVVCVSGTGLSPQLVATLRWDQLPRGYGDFAVGTNPIAEAFDGANNWVANNGSANVTKLRASDGASLGTFAVGLDPQAVAFDGANIWVTNGSNDVTKLRASDGASLGTFAVGTNPSGVAFDGANIWVANSLSNNVTKLRASDGA